MRNSDIGPSNLGKVEETQPATSGEVFSFLRETLYAGKNLSGDPDVTEICSPRQSSFSASKTRFRVEGLSKDLRVLVQPIPLLGRCLLPPTKFPSPCGSCCLRQIFSMPSFEPAAVDPPGRQIDPPPTKAIPKPGLSSPRYNLQNLFCGS
mgnify:CR=1 FL=1